MQDKLRTKAASTQDGIKFSLLNFDKFCLERFEGRRSEDIIQELHVLDPLKMEDHAYDVLQEWVTWNHNIGLAPATIRRYFSGVFRFLNYRGIKITVQEIKDNIDFPHKIVEERLPMSLEHIQEIFKVANYWKIALYLALLSSGMRIGEAVAIRKKHLKFVYSKDKQVRTRIDIPANLTKTKTGRSVFISKEAHGYIKNKLNQLDDDDLVWGVNENKKEAILAEQVTFGRYLERSGLDDRYETTNRRKLHLHSLRSYFFTKASRLDHNYAQLMLGHSGYLIREYDHMDLEEKLEMYLKLEPELLIDNTQRLKAENEKLEEEKSELEKKIPQLVDEAAERIKQKLLEDGHFHIKS